VHNRLFKLLNCTYPIIEGGLAYVGNGLLAAAVSAGGGFGQVGSGGRTPVDFAREITLATTATKNPIGVNVPISEHRDPSAYMEVIAAHADQLQAVSLSAGNPRPFVQRLHDLGLVVMTLASTPEQAQKAEAAGADIVICEGTEAGGHNGPAELTTMTLIPQVVRVVNIPVIAAGGLVDGPTIAAAFALGAEGVQLGTRFVATLECQAHVAYKKALVEASASDTRVMERSFGRITRVLKSPFVDAILEQEQRTPGSFNDLFPFISGRNNATAALEGKLDEGWLNCGQSTGAITDIPSAAELPKRLMEEAMAVLTERLRFLQGESE